MDISAAFYLGDRRFGVETVASAPPAAGEVEIDVAYCGICGTDMHVFHGNMDARVGRRRVIGHEMSGTVRALGGGVSGLGVGDKVVVRPLVHCGHCPACRAGYSHICHNLKFLGLDSDGAFQQRWCVPAHTVHRLPADMPLDHAALIEPLAVACHDVRMSRLAAGETALVIGGGPIGTLVGMVARHRGGRVLVSEINPHRQAMSRGLGFDVLDPAQLDLANEIDERTAGKGADVVFEVSGSQAGADAMTAVAAARGRIVMVAIHAQKRQVDLFRFFWRELEMIGTRVYEPQDYDDAIGLIASGAIDAASLITDVRPLERIQEAFEALDANPVAMKSLIRCSDA